jgi:hypothetical protein
MSGSAGQILVRLLAAGIIIPCVLFSIILLFDLRFEGPSEWLILVPWPTAVLLMAAEGSGNDRGLLLAFLFSAAANALVYVLIGALVVFVKGRFAALQK